MSGIKKRRSWTVLIIHTIRGHVHRYACHNCGYSWETSRHYDWNFCPGCGFNAAVREEFDE